MKVFLFLLPSLIITIIFMYLLVGNNPLLLAIVVVIVIICTVIYYLKAIIDLFLIWKRDKEDGDLEGIVEFIGTFNMLPHKSKGVTTSNGCFLGNFKVLSLSSKDKYNLIGNFISLQGGIPYKELVEGSNYRIVMRVHSKRLISIEPFEATGCLEINKEA